MATLRHSHRMRDRYGSAGPSGEDAGVPLAALRDWAERKAFYVTTRVAADAVRQLADA